MPKIVIIKRLVVPGENTEINTLNLHIVIGKYFMKIQVFPYILVYTNGKK